MFHSVLIILIVLTSTATAADAGTWLWLWSAVLRTWSPSSSTANPSTHCSGPSLWQEAEAHQDQDLTPHQQLLPVLMKRARVPH